MIPKRPETKHQLNLLTRSFLTILHLVDISLSVYLANQQICICREAIPVTTKPKSSFVNTFCTFCCFLFRSLLSFFHVPYSTLFPVSSKHNVVGTHFLSSQMLPNYSFLLMLSYLFLLFHFPSCRHLCCFSLQLTLLSQCQTTSFLLFLKEPLSTL